MVAGLVAGAWAQASTALTEPAAPLLPQSFGSWKMATGAASAPDAAASSVSLVNANKDALEECGPQRSQVGDYTHDGRNLHVEAVQFGDRTGAFSAYTVVKRPEMSPAKGLGSAAAAGVRAPRSTSARISRSEWGVMASAGRR